MSQLSRLFIGQLCVIGILFGAPTASANASESEDAKLLELERAMKAPALVAKPRTRAIVFDNEPSQQAGQAATVSQTESISKLSSNCRELPANVSSQAVDFAIQFNVNSSQISSTSVKVLDAIGKILSISPDRCVFVEGHTDLSGNVNANLVLSRDRANSVVNYLSGNTGLDSKRLVPVGKGSSDPLKNLNPRDPANRRVVFKVVTG